MLMRIKIFMKYDQPKVTVFEQTINAIIMNS